MSIPLVDFSLPHFLKFGRALHPPAFGYPTEPSAAPRSHARIVRAQPMTGAVERITRIERGRIGWVPLCSGTWYLLVGGRTGPMACRALPSLAQVEFVRMPPWTAVVLKVGTWFSGPFAPDPPSIRLWEFEWASLDDAGRDERNVRAILGHAYRCTTETFRGRVQR